MVTLKLVLVSCFTALGVVISPFFHFIFLGTRAFPGQHFINALAGVLIGPWWAALVAVFVGVIRNLLGVGTVFAFPGGVPGALVVGLAYKVTGRLRKRPIRFSAALLEPVGTVMIGATLSLLLVAPIVAWRPLLALIEKLGLWQSLLTLWVGWSISSVTGSVMGYLSLLILGRASVLKGLGLEVGESHVR
ncbi:MAG: energy coupling factor transporter S component ThiW [Thermoproteota archaeon]